MAFEFAYFGPFDLVFELPPYSLFLYRAFERKSRDGIEIKSISVAILGHLNAFPFSRKSARNLRFCTHYYPVLHFLQSVLTHDQVKLSAYFSRSVI